MYFDLIVAPGLVSRYRYEEDWKSLELDGRTGCRAGKVTLSSCRIISLLMSSTDEHKVRVLEGAQEHFGSLKPGQKPRTVFEA